MDVHETALWLLIGVSSAISAASALVRSLRRDYYTAHRTWREAPLSLAKTSADAALTGVGLGLAAATIIFFAAAVVARITPFG
jgi:hypothetical protein